MTQLSTQHKHIVHHVWSMLKYAYGLVCIAAGADKFFNIITNWSLYLNPKVLTIIPANMVQIMSVVGVVEIVVGLLILSSFTRLGAYLVSLWFVFVAANIISLGMFYDIAMRNLLLAVGAYALAQLTIIAHSMRSEN